MVQVIWISKECSNLKACHQCRLAECRHLHTPAHTRNSFTFWFWPVCTRAVCVCVNRVFESIIIISVVSSWCVYCPHTHTHSLFKWKWENRFNFVRFPILSSIFLIRFKFRFRLMSTWEWTSSDICFSLSLSFFFSHHSSIFCAFSSILQFTLILSCVNFSFFLVGGWIYGTQICSFFP